MTTEQATMRHCIGWVSYSRAGVWGGAYPVYRHVTVPVLRRHKAMPVADGGDPCDAPCNLTYGPLPLAAGCGVGDMVARVTPSDLILPPPGTLMGGDPVDGSANYELYRITRIVGGRMWLRTADLDGLPPATPAVDVSHTPPGDRIALAAALRPALAAAGHQG